MKFRKNILTRTLFLFLFISPAFYSKGQTGWQWGVGSMSADTSRLKNCEVVTSAIDKNGNVYCGAIFYDPDTVQIGGITISTTTPYVMVITKIDPSGNVLWALQAYNSNVAYTSLSIATDNAGNLYAYGYNSTASLTIDTLTLSTISSRAFLVKISPTGHVLWGRNPGGTPGRMGVDGGYNVYITGSFTGSTTIGTTTLTHVGSSTKNVFLAKFDANGNFVWARNFGGVADAFFENSTVTQTGSLYLTGSFTATAPGLGITIGTTNLLTTRVAGALYVGRYMSGFDSSGNNIWARNLPYSYGLTHLCPGPANGLYGAGRLDSNTVVGPSTLTKHGSEDIFIGRYDANGNVVWANSGGGYDGEYVQGITAACNGDVLISAGIGIFPPMLPYTSYFDNDSLVLTAVGPDQSLVVRYSASGNFITGLTLPSGGDDMMDVLSDSSGNFYIAGDYYETQMIFGTDTLPYRKGETFFVSKYGYTIDCMSTGIPSASTERNEISIYPNPSYDQCTISANAPFASGAHALIYDLSGRVIETVELTGTSTTFSVENISQGLYICVIYQGNEKVEYRKLTIVR